MTKEVVALVGTELIAALRYEQQEADSYISGWAADEIERLTRERDEWGAKWHKVRAELAKLKYPGMKGIVRPAHEPNPDDHQKHT